MSYRIFTSWITCPRPSPDARFRLFCLPFAGGGASTYRLWPSHLPPAVEVCPVQLPGREERYREPAFTSVIGLSRAVARELAPYLDRPFALFGHSMGALLAFEIARALRHSGAAAPAALLLAAYPEPAASSARVPIHHLPDADFIAEMRRLQGTPEAVLHNDELMAFMLPILRADFRACDTYRYTPGPPLDCPIVAYGGRDDREVGPADLDAWRVHTTASFDRRLLDGNHFFVQSQRDALLADVGGRLAAASELHFGHGQAR